MKYNLIKHYRQKYTWKDYLSEFKEIHSDQYTYEDKIPLEAYISSHVKIEITCKKHGKFFQDASNHKIGYGCYECGREKTIAGISDDKLSFISKAEEIHNDKYDYSLVEYIDSQTKVKIKCSKCYNIFEQTPGSHLNKRGCPLCAIKFVHDQQKKTLEIFIKEAKEIYGEQFDYSKAEYKGAHHKILIICNKCGSETFIKPNNHLRNHGCRKCTYEENSGSNHYWWNPDLTIEDRLSTRGIDKNNKWRKKVFQRDNWTCQISGLKGKIEAHHIASYKVHPKLRFRIFNGITIHESIHKLFHKIFGNRKTNLRQWKIFIESWYPLYD